MARGRPWKILLHVLWGGAVLSSYERRRFNEIVSGLLSEDPGFGIRNDAPPKIVRPRPLVALLLWLSMPFMVAMGGWTGLLVAVAAGVYGAHLRFRGRPLPPSQARSQ
jgi:hypothetical protein